MYLGDGAGLPVRNDLMNARCMLRFHLDVDRAVVEQYWEEALEFECCVLTPVPSSTDIVYITHLA